MPLADVAEFFGVAARDPILRTLRHEHMRFLTALASFSSPPEMGSLAAAADMPKDQTSRIGRVLAKLGLVERMPATDEDWRIVRIRLTDEGLGAYERLAKAYRNRP